MGEFMLDFSAYNALLPGSNGYGGSYYGPDDVFLGGGDPGFSLLTNVGRRHFQHVHNQQQLHQQQQQLNRGQAQPGSHAATAAAAAGHHSHHHVNRRYLVNDRNSLARLEAEKTLQDRRKAHIANFGATWLKPPGVSKTLFQIREECREQEEQAEAERREELAQQLVQAEAAAAMEAEEAPEPGWAEGAEEDGEAEEGGDLAGEGTGQDDMDAGSVANEEGELDLDNEIPDAEDFSFGNNEDGSDDPFASSEEGEDDEGSDDGVEDDEDDEDSDNGPDQPDLDDTFDQGRPQERMLPDQQAAYTPLPPGASGRRRYRESGEGSRAPGMSPFAGLSGAPASFVTPVHAPPALSVEDRREQVRARAAERRETHQIRATEDRVRAMLTQPRLSALGGIAGSMSGLYGDDDDLDEDDQAQMLQEDDLVRESIGRAAGGRGGNGTNGSSRRLNRRSRDSLGNGGAGNAAAGLGDGSAVDDEEGGNYYTGGGGAGIGDYLQDESGLEMDMDADLDEDVPEGTSPAAVAMDMDISAYDDGAYEHTDTEAELSSSVFDGDHSGHAQPARSRYQRERSGLDVDDGDDAYDVDDMDFDVNGAGAGAGDTSGLGGGRRHHDVYPGGGDDLPHHSFLAGGLDASGNLGYGRAAPRSSNAGMAGGSGSARAGRARPARGSLGRSDRNSLDISGLLSQDGSSNVGSSPGQVRWQH